MYKYILTREERRSGDYGSVEKLGVFDKIDNVNEFLQSTGYPNHIKFISCKQIIESRMNNVPTKLTLTSIPFNPIDRIGELRNAFKEVETIMDLRCAMDQTADDMIANEDTHVVVEPRFLGSGLFLQFCQFGISLFKDGTWKYGYTGYGSDYAEGEDD